MSPVSWAFLDASFDMAGRMGADDWLVGSAVVCKSLLVASGPAVAFVSASSSSVGTVSWTIPAKVTRFFVPGSFDVMATLGCWLKGGR